MTKGERIRQMLLEGEKYPKIIREVGCSGSTVAYHARQLGKQQFSFERKNYNWEEIQEFYDEGNTIAETVAKFGLNTSSIRDASTRGEFVKAPTSCPDRKARVKQLRQSLAAQGITRGRGAPLSELFVENSMAATSAVKKRILRDGLLAYSCSGEQCPLASAEAPMWAGAPIVLHLDHINGVRNDHRLENLRFLCPNCHSQTDTYCGRNQLTKKHAPS